MFNKKTNTKLKILTIYIYTYIYCKIEASRGVPQGFHSFSISNLEIKIGHYNNKHALAVNTSC